MSKIYRHQYIPFSFSKKKRKRFVVFFNVVILSSLFEIFKYVIFLASKMYYLFYLLIYH